MANRTQLVEHIRFALHNLSARSGHHEFEALCREVARVKVTPNLVPATGPVSAGGDQGRDFETFRARVTPRLGETGLLLGLDGTELVAFACTLQQDGLDQKIRSDIETICSGGEQVAGIFVYCEGNVVAARRHVLQAEARDRWGVALDVIDGGALAEQLADRSLFWAAIQHLSIPSELAPDTEEAGAYSEGLRRWQERESDPSTPGDFLALRRGLRDATFTADYRGDLPFWLSRMRLLIPSTRTELARRARYEVVVATLRGLGHLRASEDAELVRSLLSDAEVSRDEAALEDASVVLLFCIGARARNLINIGNDELMNWNAQLRDHVEHLLAEGLGEGRRCALLDILGTLYAQPDIRHMPLPASPISFDIDEILRNLEQGGPFTEAPSGPLLVDPDRAVAAWLELARLLEHNWLFPIDSLATRVGYIAPLLSNTDGYQELVLLLDEAVARTSGRSAVAERCRDRAVAHYRAGRVRDAMVEFHRARVDWLSGDTLRGSLLAQLFVAQCYLDLGLPLAARYFWLATAHIATRSPELTDLVAPALFGAARADYHDCAWFSSLDLIERAFRAQLVLADDPWDPSRFEYLNYGFLELAIIAACARRLGEPSSNVVDEVIERLGVGEFLHEATAANAWWDELTTEELGTRVAVELGRPGFADAGPTRSIVWRALGVEWRLSVRNEHVAVVAAERLAAVMQVVMAELSIRELAIAPTTVRIDVVTLEPGDPRRRPEFRPSNDGRQWQAWLLPASESERGPEAFAEALVVMFDVLGDVSLLPSEQLDDLVRTALSEGIAQRFAPMLAYDQVIPTTIEEFNRSRRSEARTLPPQDAHPSEHADLAWPSSPGPGYELAAAETQVRTRYDVVRRLMPFSITELMHDEGVGQVCTSLRDEGWKDWHLLQALTSLVMSFRISLLGLTDFDAIQAEGRRIAQLPEPTDASRMPANLVTLASMREALRMSMLVTIRNWPLELHQSTPDFPAIERLLAGRYGFWDVDVPHEQWWDG